MDVMFGVSGGTDTDKFVLVVANKTHARSIVKMDKNMDKLRVISDKIVGCTGEIGDVAQFCDYVQRNVRDAWRLPPLVLRAPAGGWWQRAGNKGGRGTAWRGRAAAARTRSAVPQGIARAQQINTKLRVFASRCTFLS